MKPTAKRILTISAIAAGAGLILMGIGMGLGGRPGVAISSSGIHSSYQQQEPYFQEKMSLNTFSDLSLDIGAEADIQILPSDDDKYYVEYLLDGDYGKPVCKVEDDTFTLTQIAAGNRVIGIFAFNLGESESINPYVTLYVPEDSLLKQSSIHNTYGSIEVSGSKFETISITADSGDIILNNVSAGDMKLNYEDGNLTTDALKADNFFVCSDYGSIELKESILGCAEFELEDGDVSFDTVKGNSIKITSEYGNVNLEETSCKTADFILDYGNLDFDAVTLENLTCEMEDGNMNLSLPETLEKYQIAIDLDYGDLKLPEGNPK